MSFNFEASQDFELSLKNIDTLIDFATTQRDEGNEENRLLFLKLAVVSSVTRFQVLVEHILKDYHFLIRNCGKKYGEFSPFLRLNSVRLYTNEQLIHKRLERTESYSNQEIQEIKAIAENILHLCNDESTINEQLKFETKFPLGKTGLQELTKLFRQIKGEEIFANPPFDIYTFNEILGKRHSIVHEDKITQLTEEIVVKYRNYLAVMVGYIDEYLTANL